MFSDSMLDVSTGITNLFNAVYYEHLDWGRIYRPGRSIDIFLKYTYWVGSLEKLQRSYLWITPEFIWGIKTNLINELHQILSTDFTDFHRLFTLIIFNVHEYADFKL